MKRVASELGWAVLVLGLLVAFSLVYRMWQ